MSKSSLRKFVQLGDVKFKDVHTLTNHWDGEVQGCQIRQAPTGVAVIGRVMQLASEFKGGVRIKIKEAVYQASEELSEFWSMGMNVYPLSVSAIAVRVLSDFEEFKKLKNYSISKRTKLYYDRVKVFNDRLQTGYDIRSTDKDRVKKLTELYGVPMEVEDMELYKDNCKEKTCLCPWDTRVKCADCPRRMFVSDIVAEAWLAWRIRKDNKAGSEAKLQEQADDYEASAKKVNYETDPEVRNNFPVDNTVEKDIEQNDSDFAQGSSSKIRQTDRTTRQDTDNISVQSSTHKFPSIPIRTSRKKLNPVIMRAVVHIQSKYKISQRDTEGIFVDISRMVFNQPYTNSASFETDADEEDEDEVEETEPPASAVEDQVEPVKKKRKVQMDLKYRFPARETVRKWIEDAALLNLAYVGRRLTVEKREDEVSTFGGDDTTKAAGHRLFDSKTSNITIARQGEEGKVRETLTTGFVSNISHSGKDQTEALRFKLQMLGILAGVSEQEIIDSIDFWMNDRSADGDVVMEELNISEEKILKCNAHIILAIEKAIDSVLLELESDIGNDKLIGPGAGNKAFQKSSSIITLGLIALSKLLSPSHAALSYSLYSAYKTWRKETGKSTKDFLGFNGNRFGRPTELAILFLEHKTDLIEYFHDNVDEHSNHLVLAVLSYIESEWFETGCKVYREMGSHLIVPMKRILGIDKFAEEQIEDRNWIGVKNFFDEKLKGLEELKNDKSSKDTFKQLIAKAADKIFDAMERQLGKMKFFTGSVSEDTLSKMRLAPLTNSGCESRQAELDVRVKHSGGSAPLETLSDKQIVSVNGYLLQPIFETDAAGKEWLWARSSAETKACRELRQEFLARVCIAKRAKERGRELVKKRKLDRAHKLFADCLGHGGPVTLNNLEILDKLEEKDVIIEVSYLKATIAKEIKLRKRVKHPVIPGKFKMEKLPVDQLKNSIRNVLKPDAGSTETVENLLKEAFSKKV